MFKFRVALALQLTITALRSSLAALSLPLTNASPHNQHGERKCLICALLTFSYPNLTYLHSCMTPSYLIPLLTYLILSCPFHPV
jgi:hypothetical protein